MRYCRRQQSLHSEQPRSRFWHPFVEEVQELATTPNSQPTSYNYSAPRPLFPHPQLQIFSSEIREVPGDKKFVNLYMVGRAKYGQK